VVLLTADPTPSARQTAFAAGVDGFLVKPLEPDLLLDELLRLIGPSQTSAFSHSLPV
jgi:CheY-like chemotaxis protein